MCVLGLKDTTIVNTLIVNGNWLAIDQNLLVLVANTAVQSPAWLLVHLRLGTVPLPPPPLRVLESHGDATVGALLDLVTHSYGTALLPLLSNLYADPTVRHSMWQAFQNVNQPRVRYRGFKGHLSALDHVLWFAVLHDIAFRLPMELECVVVDVLFLYPNPVHACVFSCHVHALHMAATVAICRGGGTTRGDLLALVDPSTAGDGGVSRPVGRISPQRAVALRAGGFRNTAPDAEVHQIYDGPRGSGGHPAAVRH